MCVRVNVRTTYICADSSAPQWKKNFFVYSNFISNTGRSLHTDGANLKAISLHFKGFFRFNFIRMSLHKNLCNLFLIVPSV